MKSIGTTLALKISFVLILVMTVFGVWDVFQRKEQLQSRLSSKQERVRQQLVLLLGELLFDVNDEQIENVLRSYLADPDILAITVLEEKRIVKDLGRSPASDDILDLTDADARRPAYLNTETLESPIFYTGEDIGTLRLVFSRQSVLQQVRTITLTVSSNILLVIIIEMLAIILLARKNISRPLLELSEAARRISQGDLRIQHFKRRSSTDEIATLSQSFIQMSDYLQQMADIARNISHGDLRDEVQVRSDKDVLGQAFSNMIAYLEKIAESATAIAEGDFRNDFEATSEYDVLGNAFQQMNSLRHLMSHIMTDAKQLRVSAKELHSISANMAASIEQTSQQAQMMSENSRQVSENVDAVATSTEQFSSNIREVSVSSNKVARIINSAVEISKEADVAITGLESGTQEIGEIIAIISAITQQTNLLALNATIEAARAGDLGKGFAVVAHEVKELSKEVASSTEGIIRKLEIIQSRSHEVRDSITSLSDIIIQVRNLSDSIAGGIEEQSITTQDIARRMLDSAQSSQEITRVTAEVAASAQETSSGATKVRQAAGELNSLADHLQQLISKFQI